MVAPTGTVAVAVVAFVTENLVAAVLLKLMPVAPVKLVPVSVTLVPATPLVGERLLSVGSTAKGAVGPWPHGRLTATLPVEVAAAGTTKVKPVAVRVLMVAAAPFTVRAVAPLRLVPLTVTVAPAAAEVGLRLLMVAAGGAMTVTIAVAIEVLLKTSVTVRVTVTGFGPRLAQVKLLGDTLSPPPVAKPQLAVELLLTVAAARVAVPLAPSCTVTALARAVTAQRVTVTV